MRATVPPTRKLTRRLTKLSHAGPVPLTVAARVSQYGFRVFGETKGERTKRYDAHRHDGDHARLDVRRTELHICRRDNPDNQNDHQRDEVSSTYLKGRVTPDTAKDDPEGADEEDPERGADSYLEDEHELQRGPDDSHRVVPPV